MAKYTLLQLVQKALSSTDGDEVNSISDTVESLQMAHRIEDVFYNLVTNHAIPEHVGLLKLEALADSSRPNYLKLPARVSEIKCIRYDKGTADGEIAYREVFYRSPEEFLDIVTLRDATADNVLTVEDINTDVRLLVVTDRMPTYWTSFDDEYLVFDSYDSSTDSTLQHSKTMVVASRIPEFRLEDTFVMDMDDNLFPMLLNEVKSWSFVEDKQTSHPKAEQNAKIQRRFYQSQRHRIGTENQNKRPDYGRRR